VAVRIEEIHVQDVGPIKRFGMRPGIFNLIFGHNEKGKTLLVEFIIRSLFRNAKLWTLRDMKGSGKVRARGLESKAVDFSPSSTQKLEDYWEAGSGLPPDFSRLLVVKGAEVELSASAGGIDKTILKHFLSSQGLLDQIDNDKNISKTVKNCSLEKNVIVYQKRDGEIKRREEKKDILNKLDDLFERIDGEYSRGNRKTLADKKEAVLQQISQLDRAKRHLAFTIDEEKKKLERELKNYDEEKIQEIITDIGIYRRTVRDLDANDKKLKDAQQRSTHYEWLKKASETYEKLLEFKPTKRLPLFGILAVVCVVLTALSVVFDVPVGIFAALAGILIFGVLFFLELYKEISRRGKHDERKSIEAEFEKRMREKLTDTPKIRMFLDRMQEDYNSIKTFSKERERLVKEKEDMENVIHDVFRDLTGEKVAEAEWNEKLSALKEVIQNLKSRLEEKKTHLIKLNVDPSDYEPEPQEAPYSQKQYDALQDEMKILDDQIKEEDQRLEHLKRDIYQETRDKQDGDWESVIHNLREKREETLKEYKHLTAEIVGKIITHETVEALRKGEDEKIVEGLQSAQVLTHLRCFTGRYEKLDLAGDRLIVSDPYDDFPLAGMSTGAQEQVLLALRIGFAQKLTKQSEPLFLILDDAFQYSDWERRGWLMDAMVGLAKSGWQILYFSMDDHIGKLFEQKGKVFGGDFVMKELD